MPREMQADSKSLTVRQRARRRAKNVFQEDRAKLERIEKAFTNLLVAFDRVDEVYAKAGQQADELLKLGQSRKNIAEKTGVSQGELAKAINLAKELYGLDEETAAPASSETSGETDPSREHENPHTV